MIGLVNSKRLLTPCFGLQMEQYHSILMALNESDLASLSFHIAPGAYSAILFQIKSFVHTYVIRETLISLLVWYVSQQGELYTRFFRSEGHG